MPFLHMKSVPALPQEPEESNGSLALELQRGAWKETVLLCKMSKL